jgi:uncharacterized repeat protein (TIGR01451 family)/fimbrial isopeptide formation D2 family protein/LPXTG-motif cell wall-anchored protein
VTSTPAKRGLLVALSLVFSLVQTVPSITPTADAAGSPDIALAVTVDGETLHGAATPVTLTASNAPGPDGFNLSYRVTLPPGVSYAGGAFAPTILTDVPAVGQTTLFFENISDLPTGGTADLAFTVTHSTSAYSVGDTLSIDADAYVNSDERTVPDIDPATGVVTDITGYDSGSGSTLIIPFQVTKSEPSPEAELLRGLHDQQTIYTIDVQAAPFASTTALTIEDWIPAGIEFLGCGGTDNSSIGEEYPGSGPISVGAVGNCYTPSLVETVDSGIPAGLPPGVYTHVVWDNAALGGASIGAGATFTMNYAAAIPMNENTMTWTGVAGVPPTTGEQARNIDNNNGASTAETTTERAYTNFVFAGGTYSGDGNPYTDDGQHTVTSEDVSMQKTVDTAVSAIGTISTWTLTVRTSEYAASSDGVIVSDTVPDGLCPGGGAGCSAPGPSTPYASIGENADGTWSISWAAGSFPANATGVITYSTEQLGWYQENGADHLPVLADDSWTNDAQLVAFVGPQEVRDESSASQRTVLTSVEKDVAVPGPAPVSCGDGSAITWNPTTAGPYGPGDRVCWRIQLDTPSIFGGDQKLSDYLPTGFTFESWTLGANNTVPPASINFDGSGAGSGVLVWTFDPSATRITPPDTVFEAVISSIAGNPNDFNQGDIVGNLLKHSGLNSDGDLYFNRDLATLDWREPLVNSIVKTATATEIQANDVVDFTLAVTNNGNQEALNVGVWDILPRRLECTTVSAISDSGVCNTGANPDQIEWVIPSIAAGATFNVTYRVTVPSTVAPRETYTNDTGVRRYEGAVNTGVGDVFEYVPVNNIDPTLEPSANTAPALDSWTLNTRNVVIDKSRTTSLVRPGNNRNSQATIGETVSFTIDITIPEGTTLYSTPTLTDVIDSRYVYQGDAEACAGPSATPCVVGTDPLGPWTIDDIAGTITVTTPGDFTVAPGGGDYLIRVAFSTTVDDVASNVRNGLIRNRARFVWRDSGGTRRARSNDANVRLVEPNLTITKTNNDADNVVDAGQVLTYTLTVLNDNSIARVTSAFDVSITDDLPAGLTCASVSNISDGGVCTASNTVEWNTPANPLPAFGELRRGNSFVVTFDTTLPSPIIADTVYTNSATVGGSSLPGTTAGERDPSSPNGGLGSGYLATDTDTVTAPRSSITKTVDPGVQTVGEPVQYTVVVTVPGNVQQYDTTVIDMLPAGIATSTSGYTVSTSCEMSGGPCTAPYDIVPIELTPNGRTVGWFLGDQTNVPGVPRTVTIVYDARVEDLPAVLDGVTLTNEANVYGNKTDKITTVPPIVPDAPSFDVAGIPATADVLVREPNLTITKAVLDGATLVDARRALAGEDLVYRLTITNTGNWPAYDVDVSDTIATFSGDAMVAVDVSDGTDNGVAYVVVDGDPSNGDLAWAVDGPIPVGTSFVIEYTLRVWNADATDEDPTGPEITNTASLDEYWAVATPNASIHRRYVGGTDVVNVELDLASVGDYVWFDVNNDGVQDAGEPPIPGVEVTVVYFGLDGVPGGGDDETHVTTTDAAGMYLVSGLPGGEYSVTVTGGIPPGLTESYDLDDGTTAPDGRWLGSLAEDAVERDVDFGYTGTGSIGDLVWFNRNANTTQDTDEPGIGGVDGTVTFYGFDGVAGGGDDVVYPVTTAPDGSYLVSGLPAGNYVVAFNPATVPTGMSQNFDPDGTLDNTYALTLGVGEDFTTADFGYAGDSSIGDRVWLDENRDGVQDAGEPGIAGVDVDLVWPGPDGVTGTPDDVTFTETTDSLGNYLFGGLNPGSYPVTVVTATLPVGLDNTYDEDGDLDDAVTVALPLSTDHLTADFGYAGSASIGDFVWWDLNADGVQDAGEPGVPNVDVTVVWAGPDGTIGTGDDLSYPTLTDAAGAYLVENLPAGLFRVTVSGPITTAAVNTYNLDGGADNTSDVTLATNETRLDLDFGYAGTGSLGDFVWFDVNGDGVQDAGEPGLGGATVTATFYGLDGVAGGGDDVVRTTVTAADGSYGFADLPAGTYLVEVDPATLPAGMTPTVDRDATPDGSTELVLAAAETILDVDFGYVGTGLIGDTIWWDLDRDGTRVASEPGWPGVDVTVTWFGVDGIIGTPDDAVLTATTNAGGLYLATGLPAGSYRVDVDRTALPPDASATFDPDGGTPDRSELVLAGGESNVDQDFGYAGDGSIGDFVWLDVNGDTIQDPFEPGMSAVGITITWLGLDGVAGGGDDLTITTATDASGIYGVGGLVGGDYEVVMDTATLPPGYAANSDLDGGDPATTAVSLGSGETKTDVDYGIVGLSSLTGTVWHDKNADGLTDPGELGIPGAVVDVTWAGPLGNISFTVTTDALGAWSLPSVPPGSYTTVIDMTTVPAGFVNTTPDTVDVVVPVGGTGNVDFGVVGGVTVGSLVWVDENGNGIIDNAERGIQGVFVEFMRNGVVVATATTDVNGRYVFVDQFPGAFTVRLDATTIPQNLTQTYSKDGVLNLATNGTVDELGAVLDVNFGFQEQQLPVTGADIDLFGAVAVAFLLLGALLLLGFRRREDGI